MIKLTVISLDGLNSVGYFPNFVLLLDFIQVVVQSLKTLRHVVQINHALLLVDGLLQNLFVFLFAERLKLDYRPRVKLSSTTVLLCAFPIFITLFLNFNCINYLKNAKLR